MNCIRKTKNVLGEIHQRTAINKTGTNRPVKTKFVNAKFRFLRVPLVPTCLAMVRLHNIVAYGENYRVA